MGGLEGPPKPPAPRFSDRPLARCHVAEELLDDHAVAPLDAELAVALIGSDDPEARAFVQDEARGVLREDPRDQLPEATRLVLSEQRFERDAAGAGAARGAVDVHRMLRDARVGRTAAIGSSGRPR